MRTAEEVLSSFEKTEFMWNMLSVLEAMKTYAKEACEEQKRICAERADIEILENNRAFIDEQSILDAPLPNMK